MKNLNEMCCDNCREKLTQIEARAAMAPTPTTMAEAFADRRDLLEVVDQLLLSVAESRTATRALREMLVDEIRAGGQARDALALLMTGHKPPPVNGRLLPPE